VRYWWVNQNQTYQQEIEGGYGARHAAMGFAHHAGNVSIHAPRTGRDGSTVTALISAS
jgi:hypothetical protein